MKKEIAGRIVACVVSLAMYLYGFKFPLLHSVLAAIVVITIYGMAISLSIDPNTDVD